VIDCDQCRAPDSVEFNLTPSEALQGNPTKISHQLVKGRASVFPVVCLYTSEHMSMRLTILAPGVLFWSCFVRNNDLV
jgi:hypothetical protein